MKNLKIFLLTLIIFILTGCSNYKVTKNETHNIKYEKYDNGLFSMQIPKGWQVSVGPFDYIHYTFIVYNPTNPSYKIYFNMKSEGYLKTEKMRNWYKSYYPTAPMATLPAIDPQTTEQFYKKFSEAMTPNNTNDFVFPTIKEFTVIEKLGNNITGGEIVRASYKNENDETIDGIFTTTIKEVSLYYVTALNVYTTIFYTTPEGELTEWQRILNYSLSTLEFSKTFINGFNNQEEIIATTTLNNSKIYNEMSDIITKGWEARQSTYDIISQKQSDATLGYERVYDTDTGEIYKAKNGFMDNYHGKKYQTITDEMYNLPTYGYIE